MGIIGFSAAANNTYVHPLFTTVIVWLLSSIPAISRKGGNDLAQPVLAAHHSAGMAQFRKVVDHRFRVYGTEGLYVADASVFPIKPPANAMASA
jgi:choline dehydrogenase-like flavoprotein